MASALEPLKLAVALLGDDHVRKRIAGARPQQSDVAAVRGRGPQSREERRLEEDLNDAANALRWAFLRAAEAAGAARQIDATPAIWAFEVDDGEWSDAETTIEAAIRTIAGMVGHPVPPAHLSATSVVLDVIRSSERSRTAISGPRWSH